MINTTHFCASIVVAAVCLIASTGQAQQSERNAHSDAPLVVEGVVRQIFRGGNPQSNESLLQIDVQLSEARKPATGAARFPAPGEPVYAHAPRGSNDNARASSDNRADLPTVGSQVRVYLKPREQGGWEGASAHWYEPLGERKTEINAGDLAREAVEHAKRSTSLGMTTELLRVDDRLVLRVTSVERGGPAQTAGLEVGDVIPVVDGAPITSANQLSELAAQGKKLSLVVVDVNTGRGTRVEIDPRGKPAGTTTTGTTTADAAPPAQPTRISLGLSAEPVALGARSALKVLRVEPDGPAAKAGIEAGDIVVAANGAPTTGVEQLLSALRKGGSTLKLTVRDSRTGRDVDVDVNLGGTAKTPPAEPDTVKVSSGKLGAVTELAFHDTDFAVKVTEVEPNSAAARAGLRPGLLIVTADGKPVLHPNDLNDAARKSTGKLALGVLDPASGKKSNVEVQLK